MKRLKFLAPLLGLLAVLFAVGAPLDAQTITQRPIKAALLGSGTKPQASYDFRAGIPAPMTFSRASGATQVASDGLVKWAPENLISRSEMTVAQLNAATQTGITDAVPSITGFVASIQFTGNATSRGAYAPAITTVAAYQYVLALYVQMDDNSVPAVGTGSSNDFTMNQDGSTGTVASITQVGSSSVYRIVTTPQTGTGIGNFGVNKATTNSAKGFRVTGWHVYRSPNVDNTYVKTTGSQYFGPRIAYDPTNVGVNWGYQAEMQSTNAVAFSHDITATGWSPLAIVATANATTAPDGTTTASTIKEDGTTAPHSAQYSTITFVSGSVYGVSTFLKNITGSRWAQCGISGGDFVNVNPSTGAIGSKTASMSNVVMQQLPNGWWWLRMQFTSGFSAGSSFRCYMVLSSTSTAGESYAGDNTSKIAMWCAMVETAGVGNTSCIPTAGSAVTRSQDILSLPLTSLPGWNASKGGVLVAAYRLHTLNPASPGYGQGVLQITDGTANNTIIMFGNRGGGGQNQDYIASGGAADLINVDAAPPPVFTRRKHALGWKDNGAQASYDGTNTVTSAGVPLPIAPTTFYIGSYGTQGQTLNGTLESVAYYAGARPDAFVQAVSR